MYETVGEKAQRKQHVRNLTIGIGSWKVLTMISLHFQTKVFNPIHWVHPKEEVNLGTVPDSNVNQAKTKGSTTKLQHITQKLMELMNEARVSPERSRSQFQIPRREHFIVLTSFGSGVRPLTTSLEA